MMPINIILLVSEIGECILAQFSWFLLFNIIKYSSILYIKVVFNNYYSI